MRSNTILLFSTVLLAAACAGPATSAGGGAPTPGDRTAPADREAAVARGEAAAPSAAGPSPAVVAAAARADSVRSSYTEADVAFMRDMIHHHAQAIVMARMAPTHGASASLQIMAARIINAQNDEIALMQQWLRSHGEPVPEVANDDMHGGHGEHRAPRAMQMAGMLTPDQLASLDAARDAEFERLFLTYMIQHHRGALTMANELFSTYGAAQNDAVFKLASDISADQASEIDRMQSMLRELVFGSDAP